MEDDTVEDILKAKARLFHSTLRENSISQEDPIPEWKVVIEYEGDGEERCICSTPIVYKYVIENTLNGKRLTIGSECVKRWNINFVCKICGSNLGNVTRRLLKRDFVCPECKRNEERKRKFQEAQRLEHKGRLGRYLLYWYGPYYKQPFSRVIQDISYVEYLVNLPNKTKTLEQFEEYVKLCYDIITVPVEKDACLIE